MQESLVSALKLSAYGFFLPMFFTVGAFNGVTETNVLTKEETGNETMLFSEPQKVLPAKEVVENLHVETSFNESYMLQPRRVTFAGPRANTKPKLPVTEEDKKVRLGWGGDCTANDWDICSHQTFFGQLHNNTLDYIPPNKNCTDQRYFPPLCLHNGWTVTKCNLWCMGKLCNRDIKINYDKYVSKDGYCWS